MPEREPEPRDRLPWVPMAVAATASAALTATLFGVQATAVLPRQPYAVAAGAEATSGTLDLRLSSRGAGFDQRIGGLAPGDVVHRYVVLRNAGTLPGRQLTLSAASSPTSPLTADSARTRALRASVALCAGATWSSSRGTCGGQVIRMLPPLPLGALGAGRELLDGEVQPGESLSLRVTLELPPQDEVVVNGQLPQQSVQGARTSVTWTFRQQQATQPG